jgi:hypothetical protein
VKQILSIILCLALLSLSIPGNAESSVASPTEINWEQDVKFTGMSDETLLPYIEDTVYSQLVADLDSDEFFIEDVSAVYVSQEYLTELAYNSQENVFFGYSLSGLDEYFQGTRYVFTVDDNGQTTVEPLQVVKDTTYEQLLKNVAVGTGVILVCVTVSAVTGGLGTAPAVSMIFAVAAKTAATCALSGTLISGVSAAVVKGYETGDLSEALKAGALGASEGYKWGAISGAITGAASETWGLFRATRLGKTVENGLTMNQAAMIQKETGYPLNIIKQFHSYDEYLVFKNAGLQSRMINGQLALVRSDINLSRVDEYGRTNLERMLSGKAPLDSTGKPFELHHIGQKNNGSLAILTSKEHDAASLHGFVSKSEIDRDAFNATRKPEFWKTMGRILSGGN